ncbi:MAG: beta-mannanase [Anaerolineae bacterium]|nr:beta-mannanase [Anaerolineae bacterium]
MQKQLRRRPLLLVLYLYIILACGVLFPNDLEDEGEEALPVPQGIESPSAYVQTSPTPLATTPQKIIPPSQQQIYHGIFPGGISGEESDISLKDLQTYEQLAGKTAAWVYFSHNWYEGHDFPLDTANWIRDSGSVPYIRLMLRSSSQQGQPEPLYTLDAILSGEFDADLHRWAQSARLFGSPLLAEFGTEVNGEWFPWNGTWHGGGRLDGYGDNNYPDGPERFRDTYRHIVEICRSEQADNITWVFHVNNADIPENAWNQLENYYPGEEWVDWVAVSVYGAQTPMETEWQTFEEMMDKVYPRLTELAVDKPIIVSEFGVTANNPHGDQAQWADLALQSLIERRWEKVIGFSWWNEGWQNDDNPAHDTNMRLQDNPALAEVFWRRVGQDDHVLGRLKLSPP